MTSKNFIKCVCKLNIETVQEAYDITFEGCEPRLTTGYITDTGISSLVAIPIRELMKQGVSLHNTNLNWFDTGDVMCEDRPCKLFYVSEVDILCS